MARKRVVQYATDIKPRGTLNQFATHEDLLRLSKMNLPRDKRREVEKRLRKFNKKR